MTGGSYKLYLKIRPEKIRFFSDASSFIIASFNINYLYNPPLPQPNTNLIK